MNTKHFTIVFEEQDAKTALEIAGFCEDVYAQVTNFFRSYPNNILCIINNKIDTANGYFSPVPPVINLYVTSPSTPLISAKNKNWLRVLLTHELTHYVNLTYHRGFFYDISNFFGKSISSVPSIFLPGWVVEGIAVKLETEFTNGGRGRNPFFEMKSKAEILENNFYSWKQAAYSSVFPPKDRIYQAGYLLLDFLGRKYGDDVFVRIYKQYIDYPLSGFEKALKKVTGSSSREIFAAMRSELKTKYSKINVEGGIQVSPDTYGNYFLPIITKKGWILYRNTLDKKNALVLFNSKTNNEKILTKVRLTDYSSYSSSINGKVTVFSTYKGLGNHPGGYTLTSDLYLLKDEDPKPYPLTKGEHLWQPAISPDGKRIVAIQKENQYSRLVNINPNNGEVAPLFIKRNTALFNPSFSPNGKKIVFVLNDKGNQDICLLNEKGDVLNLTWTIKGEKYYPRFVDDNTITFSMDTSGSLALYQLKIKDKGSLVEKIFDDPVGIYSGIIIERDLLYATYSSKGYCLKKKPLPQIEKKNNESVLIPFSYLNSNNPTVTDAIFEKKTDYNISSYFDLPKLIFTLPTFLYLDPLYQKFDFILGGTIMALSPMGKRSLNLSLSIIPEPVQIKGNLQIINNEGWMQTKYAIIQSYKEANSNNFAEQSTYQTFAIKFPLFDGSSLGTSTYLSLKAELLNILKVLSPNDFKFSLTEKDESLLKTNKYFGTAGIFFNRILQSPPGDVVPRENVSIFHDIYYPLFTDTLSKPDWKGQINISVPLPFKHQLIRIGSKWGREGTTNIPLQVSPRGFENNSEKAISIVQGMDYIFTLGVLDIPLLWGFSLQGLAGGIHIEKEINLDTFKFFPKFDPYIYLGTELTIKGGYMNTAGIGGVGLNFRLNTHSPESFDPLKDIGFSIYAGTNSFSDSFIYQNR